MRILAHESGSRGLNEPDAFNGRPVAPRTLRRLPPPGDTYASRPPYATYNPSPLARVHSMANDSRRALAQRPLESWLIGAISPGPTTPRWRGRASAHEVAPPDVSATRGRLNARHRVPARRGIERDLVRRRTLTCWGPLTSPATTAGVDHRRTAPPGWPRGSEPDHRSKVAGGQTPAGRDSGPAGPRGYGGRVVAHETTTRLRITPTAASGQEPPWPGDSLDRRVVRLPR
jgi:hypothetical protein